MARAKGQRTAKKLTTRTCSAAMHSGTCYTSGDGRTVPAREILWDSEVRGLGLRLHPSGSKTWVLRFRWRGRTRLRDLGSFPAIPLDGPIGDPRHQSARKIARRALGELAVGEDPFPPAVKGATVDDVLVTFLEAAKDRGVRQSTLRAYRTVAKTVGADLGRVLIEELDAARVGTAFRRWREEVGDVAAGRALQILRMAIRLAETRNLRAPGLPDPTADLRMPKARRRGRLFTSEEYRRIGEALEELAAVRPVYRDAAQAIRLLALTGCRRREVTELAWVEVDLPARLIRLPELRSKAGAREVALGAAALAILAALRAEAVDPEGRVFPAGGGRHELSFAVQAAWKIVRKAADLPADARLHDLRHSYVSTGLVANFSEAIVGRAVGHSTTATTRRYSHLSADPVREAVDRIGAHVDSAMAGGPVAEVEPLKRAQ
jgi:integrase